MTKRAMIDIETLGTEPGAAILSIGACYFDVNGSIGRTLYAEIDSSTCFDAGLTSDDETVEWWAEKDAELAPIDGTTHLDDALALLADFVEEGDEIWANSPKFDLSILEAAYDAVDRPVPWDFWQARDVRTIRALPNAVSMDMDGCEHDAFDDARHQAEEVAATIAACGGEADE